MTATDARVTLAAVAREASVSLSTVSKVLNGRADVSPATRERVEALLNLHGYQRRPSSTPAEPLVEIVFHELESAWAMELIRGVESTARAAGAGVVVTESGSRHAPGQDWLDAVLRRRPLGVVLVFSSLPARFRQTLAARSVPFVILDPAGDPEPDVPAVGSANWQGGLVATRHLLDLGHRRVGIVTGPSDLLCSTARLSGHRAALQAAGIEPEPELARFGDFHVEGGLARTLDLLGLPDPPTAVFAGSDLQALGALEAARTLGLRVPEDLSLVGYDDIPPARWSSPPLTTVHQPLFEMAAEATRMVLRLRAGVPTSSRVDLGVRLVVRGSTAPPRTG